jgi:hypothetical protein
MTITPMGIPDESEGKPVKVLKINGGGIDWDLVISCDGNAHRLKFSGSQLQELFDHRDNESKSCC